MREDRTSDVSTSALAHAIEANGEEWWRYFRHAPQAEVHEERELLWLTSGIPIREYTAVARTSFDPDRTTEAIDRQIVWMQQYFRAHQVGGQWLIGPSTRPANLGAAWSSMALPARAASQVWPSHFGGCQ